MAKFKKNLSNPYLYSQFSNNSSEMFDYTMANIMDNFYDSALNTSIDGKFKAVCLSGIKTEDGKATGTEENDAEKVGEYVTLVVRPLTDFGNILPDPRLLTDPVEINQLISLHSTCFTARSDYEFGVTDSVEFGQVIDCYFEHGSIKNSDFSGLRFSAPKGKMQESSYVALALIEGVQTTESLLDWSNARTMGNMISNGYTDPRFPPNQAIYIGANQSFKNNTIENGKIPDALIGQAIIGGPNRPTMLQEIVSGYDKMATAFATKFPGMNLGAWGYRPYSRQLSIKNEKPKLAAKPGTSNHGWGMAIDMHYFTSTTKGSQSLTFGQEPFLWLEENAPKYGWYHPEWAKKNGPNKKSKSKKEEPWHWEWKNKSLIIKRK